MTVQDIYVSKFLNSLENLEYGTLTLVSPHNEVYHFEGKKIGPHAHIAVHDWLFIPLIVKNGSVGFAKAYRDKLIDSDNLFDLVVSVNKNAHITTPYEQGHIFYKIAYQLHNLLKPNNRKNSLDCIHSHYDIGNAFYKLWLDETMTYSSALFHSASKKISSLKDAQNNKYQRIINTINPSGNPSGSLLEIGCGWGGFADLATQKNDYDFKGITISQEQFLYAKQRLDTRAHIAFEDYRDQTGSYDAIVSIEMFEAVGEQFWSSYFKKIKELLKPHGKAVVQTIFIKDELFNGYRKRSDFIRKFIFPGGLLPSPSRFKSEVEKRGLKVVDTFYFAEDYAWTLLAWLDNFEKSLSSVFDLGFDERFVRIWRLYLASCAANFRTEICNVGQVQITHA